MDCLPIPQMLPRFPSEVNNLLERLPIQHKQIPIIIVLEDVVRLVHTHYKG